MKERPILFSGEMVRAILEGRKTQTRRVVKPQPAPFLDGWKHWDKVGGFFSPCNETGAMKRVLIRDCPYGQRGDRLWVRETLQRGARNNPAPRHNHLWRYAADNALVMVAKEQHTEMLVWSTHKEGDTCVSIHMPRWASRITLEIVNVRVERLQNISEADALAEGVKALTGQFAGCFVVADNPGAISGTTAKECYARLWDVINAKRGYPWESNTWTWVLEFKRI